MLRRVLHPRLVARASGAAAVAPWQPSTALASATSLRAAWIPTQAPFPDSSLSIPMDRPALAMTLSSTAAAVDDSELPSHSWLRTGTPDGDAAARVAALGAAHVSNADPRDVLTFWFGAGGADTVVPVPDDDSASSSSWALDTGVELESGSRMTLWWMGGDDTDAAIVTAFAPLVQLAHDGGLQAWEDEPLSALAKVLVIDQLSRNVFRGQARAFAADSIAQRVARACIAEGWADLLPFTQSSFMVMPLMHSEAVADHDTLAQWINGVEERARADLDGTDDLATAKGAAVLEYAANWRASLDDHSAIVRQFGRYPHRNAVLGRESTPEELAFLEDGPRFGQ